MSSQRIATVPSRGAGGYRAQVITGVRAVTRLSTVVCCSRRGVCGVSVRAGNPIAAVLV